MIRNMNDVLDFGKYKGHTVKHVMKWDPRYMMWAAENVDKVELNPRAARILLEYLQRWRETMEQEELDQVDWFGSSFFD